MRNLKYQQEKKIYDKKRLAHSENTLTNEKTRLKELYRETFATERVVEGLMKEVDDKK